MDHLTKLEEVLDEANNDIKNGYYEEAIEYYRKCALSTLNKDVLSRAKESIDRCKSKKELI
jgi:hypothetical protein